MKADFSKMIGSLFIYLLFIYLIHLRKQERLVIKFRELKYHVVKEWGFVNSVKRGINYVPTMCIRTVLGFPIDEHKSL